MVEFGKRLRQLRKDRYLTQAQLAELIGVSSAMISCYELSDRTPSPEILRKLAATLHVTSDYLLGIERGTVLDASGLDEQDCQVVQMMIERLREKNR